MRALSPSEKDGTPTQLFESDFYYFESMITKYKEELQRPLLMRRSSSHKVDPIEELNEVYADVKDLEQNFNKILDICSKLISVNSNPNNRLHGRKKQGPGG